MSSILINRPGVTPFIWLFELQILPCEIHFYINKREDEVCLIVCLSACSENIPTKVSLTGMNMTLIGTMIGATMIYHYYYYYYY